MREEVGGFVYILASKRFGTLYTGSTCNLPARVQQHREGMLGGFTRKYGVTRLVWFEAHDSVAAAYLREKRIKRWHRAWKISLIEEKNPFWQDLYPSIAKQVLPASLKGPVFPLHKDHTLPGRMPREGGAESRDPTET